MNKLQSIALHQKSICTNNTDKLACMGKVKWYKCKKFRDIRLYKSSVRQNNNTSMSFTGVSFSNFFYDDNIGKYWLVSFKTCCSLIVCHLKLKYNKTIVLLPIKTYCQTFQDTDPIFLLRVFRWRRTFVVWNLRVCRFMRLANHLHFLKFYKLSLRRCT